MYSLVILKGILPARYLNNFFLYVYGIYTPLGDSISTNYITLSEACLTKFVIEMEELYGVSRCTFNIHCLTHLAHCVKDCSPLWATSAFNFEAHNHVLLNMFSGTQHVPEQIVNNFLLKNKVASLTRSCIDDNCSPTVSNALNKLADSRKYEHGTVCDGLSFLGSQKLIDIDARQTLAVQNLLGSDVINQSGTVYDRFIYGHKLFCSRSYTRAKRHSNYCISFEHHSYKYGSILSLLQIHPSCQCDYVRFQYCKCAKYNVVIVKPLLINNRAVFTDVDFKVSSYFISELRDVDNVIAIFPEQIKRKCISISVAGQMYVCPLPYRIYGD